MPPPLPPQSLHNLLTSLRSPIFLSSHNPTSARLGTKYLSKPLAGPSITKYYPTQLPLKALNAQVPWNKYANWQGLPIAQLVARDGKSKSVSGQMKEKWIEKDREWIAKPVIGRENTEVGFKGVKRVEGAGWLWDKEEDRRLKKVIRRRRIGKGKPKKGESAFVILGWDGMLMLGRSGEEISDEGEEMSVVWNWIGIGIGTVCGGSRLWSLRANHADLSLSSMYYVSSMHLQMPLNILPKSRAGFGQISSITKGILASGVGPTTCSSGTPFPSYKIPRDIRLPASPVAW